jgi:hypothetical protein
MTALVGKAVQNAIVQTAVGMVAGAVIEEVIGPFNDGASDQEIAFELATQVALTGAALSLLGSALAADPIFDPTFGILFGWAVMHAQPRLEKRGSAAGALINRMVQTALHKTLRPVQVSQ